MDETIPTDETAGVLGDDATPEQLAELEAAAAAGPEVDPAIDAAQVDAEAAAMVTGVTALVLTCGDLGDTGDQVLPIFIGPDHDPAQLAADLAAAVDLLGYSPPRSAAADVPHHLAATWTSRGARVVHPAPTATPTD